MSDVIVLPEDQKIFSMRELKEKGFSQYKVSKLVEEGKLIKLNKSYYENSEYTGEESDFYYAEAYAPKGVICLLSAAVYYQRPPDPCGGERKPLRVRHGSRPRRL